MPVMDAIDTARLYELLASDLQRSFRRRGFSPQDAEDMTQEVFLRVHRSRDEVVARERIPAWIRRIAHNVMVDEARRSKKRPVPGDVADPVAPSRDDKIAPLACGWLRGALAALPAEDAAVLGRSELEEKPHRVIAEELGISLSAVKSRVVRGRAKLRSALFDCCRVEFDRRGGVVGYERRGPCGDEGCGD